MERRGWRRNRYNRDHVLLTRMFFYPKRLNLIASSTGYSVQYSTVQYVMRILFEEGELIENPPLPSCH